MSKDWVTLPLEKACNIEYGTRVVKKRDAGTLYPVYGGGGATFSMDTFNRENRMVIARFGMSEQCTRFVNGKFFLNDSGLTISPVDENSIDKQFLNYQILLLNDLIYSLGRGTAQKNLNVDKFKELPISYSKDLKKQKQIVTILDEAFEVIDKAKVNLEKNIQNTKELFQSRLNEIFCQKGEGWEEKTLGEACIISMGQSPKGTSYNTEGIGIPLINGPVEFGKKSFDKTIKSKYTTKPTKLCREGDLILCVRGSTTGRMNIAGFEACIGRGVASIRYEQNQEWLNYFILSKQKDIYNLGSGATFPNVSGNVLSKIIFLIPKKEEQNRLIDIMKSLSSSTEQLFNYYQRKLENLEELKKSILQKAFSGELL